MKNGMGSHVQTAVGGNQSSVGPCAGFASRMLGLLKRVFTPAMTQRCIGFPALFTMIRLAAVFFSLVQPGLVSASVFGSECLQSGGTTAVCMELPTPTPPIWYWLNDQNPTGSTPEEAYEKRLAELNAGITDSSMEYRPRPPQPYCSNYYFYTWWTGDARGRGGLWQTTDGCGFIYVVKATGNIVNSSGGWFSTPWVYCPTGWSIAKSPGVSTEVKTGYCYKAATQPSPKGNGGPPCPDSKSDGQIFDGNPVNLGTGNKYQLETDYASQGIAFQVTRSYNSNGTFPGTRIGNNWVLGLDYQLTVDSASWVHASRPDGKVLSFKPAVGSYVPTDNDIKDSLLELKDGNGVRTGWQLTSHANDQIEIYSTTGKILTTSTPSGYAKTYTYSNISTPADTAPVADLLIEVADNLGRSIQVSYEEALFKPFTTSGGQPIYRVKSITDPAGGQITYGYDAQSNLTSVKYPDGKTKTYHYNEPTYTSGADLPNALTGITDENGVRFATFTYDTKGKAISTGHAAGADLHSLTYNADGSTTVTDPLGTARTHTFTTLLGVVKSTGQSQPGGSGCGPASSATTYDANGNVASRADFNGNKSCHAYDLTRNLETARLEGLAAGTACPTTIATYTPVANTAQRKILTDWHATFRLPIKITEAGRETATVYDTRGNITSTTIKDTASGTTRTSATAYTYHASVPGVLVKRVDDGPRTDVADLTTTDYYAPDETCTGGHFGCRGQIKQISNALGYLTRLTRYNAHGQPEEIIDPNGLVTTLTYDARQRLTRRTAGLEVTTLSYDPVGQLTQTVRADGSSVNYTYDAAHRLTQISDGAGNRIVYTLDALGNRLKEDRFDPAGLLTQTRRHEYDALSRLAKVIGAAGQTTVYTYDASGNPTGVSDPLGHATAQSYDALNRLIQHSNPDQGLTRHTYDARDNPTAVTDPRNLTTQYTLDGFNATSREDSPDRGTQSQSYDSAGNLATRTDARGVKHTYLYDALNRPTQRSHAIVTGVTATPNLAWTYDQSANGLGQLTGVSDESGSSAWSYDPHGRVLSKTQRTQVGTASLSHTQTYTYDPAGRLSTHTYPSGLQIGYSYDPQGRLSSLSLNSQPLLHTLQWQPFGAPRSWTWGNGQPAVRSFDSDGRLSAYPLGSDTRLLSYDSDGRITAYGHSNPLANASFGYDAQDRLTSYLDALGSQTYRYDANSNRSGIDYALTPYAYTTASSSNRLQSVAGPQAKTYTYDAAGNPLSDGTITFTWNAAGRLAKASVAGKTVTYKFNALDQRVIKNGSVLLGSPWRHVYDEAGHLIGEYDKNNAVGQETVWLGDTPVAVVKKDPTTRQNVIYTVQADHLNTPRVILNSSHTPVWRWDASDAFGVGQPNEDPDRDNVKFEYNPRMPGQYRDQETGLYYNYFRDYDPSTGRYVEADPIGLDGGLNLYGYALNNPLSFTDPLGLEAIPWYAPGGAVDQAGITLIRKSPIGRAASIGSMVYAACTADDPPCTPPEGTMCWEKGTGKPHAGYSEHWDIYQMQRRRSGDNQCFWAYLGGKIGMGVLIKPPPSSILPCSTYPNFTGRPPHAPR